MGSNLGAGDRTIPLPEEVHRRLSARSVTDSDVASLLAIFTGTDETGSETSARSVIEDAERPSSGGTVNLPYYTRRASHQRGRLRLRPPEEP